MRVERCVLGSAERVISPFRHHLLKPSPFLCRDFVEPRADDSCRSAAFSVYLEEVLNPH